MQDTNSNLVVNISDTIASDILKKIKYPYQAYKIPNKKTIIDPLSGKRMLGVKIDRIAISRLELYLNEAPELSINNNVIKARELVIKPVVTMQFHIDFFGIESVKTIDSPRNIRVLAEAKATLQSKGSQIYAIPEFENLIFEVNIIRNVWIPIDLRKFLNPKLKPILIFDVASFSQAIPHTKQNLKIADINFIPKKGWLSMEIEVTSKRKAPK